jgi:hypothetical protein
MKEKELKYKKLFRYKLEIDKSDCTDKKEKKIVLKDNEIQKGSFEKSYVNNGLLIHIWLIFSNFLIF